MIVSTPADPDLIPSSEVKRRFCGVTLRTILAMAASGRFPKPIYLSPKRLFWRRDQVESWFANRYEEAE